MNGKSIDDILRASDLSQFLSQAQSDNTNVEVGMSMRTNNTPAQLTMSQARPVIVAPGLGLLEAATLIPASSGKIAKMISDLAKGSKDPAENMIMRQLQQGMGQYSSMGAVKPGTENFISKLINQLSGVKKKPSRSLMSAVGDADKILSPNQIGRALKQFGGYDEALSPMKNLSQMKKTRNNFFEELEDGVMTYNLYGGDKTGFRQKKLKNLTLKQVKDFLGY